MTSVKPAAAAGERLAGESDELLRRSLLTAVTAIAQAGASEEHDAHNCTREAWAEKVLSYLSSNCAAAWLTQRLP